MNKPVKLYEIQLPSTGQTLELKFAAGALEIFCDLMDLASTTEIDKALTVPIKEHTEMVDGKEKTTFIPDMTAQFLKGFRLAVYSAAYYAALVQGKPFEFNEWSPAEWFDEVGYDPFFRMLNGQPMPEPANAETVELATT